MDTERTDLHGLDQCLADTKNTALHLLRRADSFLSLSQVWGIGVILVDESRWKAR